MVQREQMQDYKEITGQALPASSLMGGETSLYFKTARAEASVHHFLSSHWPSWRIILIHSIVSEAKFTCLQHLSIVFNSAL